MKYPPITYNLLKEKNAYKYQLDLFEKHIGLNKPIPLTKKTIQKFGTVFDIDWAARNLLDSDDWVEFKKDMDLAKAEYEQDLAHAVTEYEKVREPAYIEYSKASDYVEYEKALGPARIKFKKATDPSKAEYDKAKATEFVKLYKH